MKNKVIVILGQTATGKSDLAVKMALRLRSGRSGSEDPSGSMRSSTQKLRGAEIIPADSRQVYKKLNIGTGKITKSEMHGVPHYLINIVEPNRKFSVSQYKKLADRKIKEILSRGKTPIICGGTGFYIDAVVNGQIFPEVPPNLALRRKLVQKPTIVVFRTLMKLDPKRAKSIDPNNKVRLIRAIEIAKALGKVPKIKINEPKYDFIKIGLFLPKDKLRKNIEKRVKKMFEAGLLKEIKKLKNAGVSKNRLKEFGFEYNNPTYESVVSESIKYAKRQMTWFKRDKEIKWFDASKKINLEKFLR